MKKTIFVLIFALYLVFGVFCQSANSSSPIDLVVVLDTSSSMSGSYRETSNYLIGPFLKEFLRIGDTFHLISFSAAPKLQISRRIEGVGDAETIIARLLLMYPLDPESNISRALSFAESFASSLPNRPRKIVLISDGDAANTQNLVDESSARFRRLGAELQYIKVPVTVNGPSSGRAVPLQSPAASQSTQTSQSAQPAQAAQTTQPQPTQAAQSAQAVQATETTRPSESAQESQSTPPGESPQASAASQESGVAGPAQAQPSGQSAGGEPQALSPMPTGPAADTGQAQPAQGPSGISRNSYGINIPRPLIMGLVLLILLLLIGIIIFASRRLAKSPNRVLAKAAAPVPSKAKAEQVTASRKTDQVLEYPPARMKPLPKDKIYDENTLSGNGGPVLLNLFVADQNTAIGKRNIHSVKPGYSYTIGGGKSDFLIFLVPVPPHIAEVISDGRNCTFIPRKPDYFPDIGSQTIPNCIGKTFRVISDKKYELHIRLERYEDPLQALNKILRSIKVPGPLA